MDKEMTIDSFQNGTLRLMSQWADVYYDKYGVRLNLASVRKRRMVAGLGFHVPPHAWFLTWEEFLAVTRTPLPLCKVVGTPDPEYLESLNKNKNEAENEGE